MAERRWGLFQEVAPSFTGKVHCKPFCTLAFHATWEIQEILVRSLEFLLLKGKTMSNSQSNRCSLSQPDHACKVRAPLGLPSGLGAFACRCPLRQGPWEHTVASLLESAHLTRLSAHEKTLSSPSDVVTKSSSHLPLGPFLCWFLVTIYVTLCSGLFLIGG